MLPKASPDLCLRHMKLTADVDLRLWALAIAEFRPLGFTNRTIKALWQYEICTREELEKLTILKARAIPGVGPKAMSQLQSYLRWED